MENWLENVSEPTSLYLAWQAPDHFGKRFRWAVGTVKPGADGWVLRYFEHGAEFEAFNDGKKYEEILSLGYAGYAAFSTKVRVHTAGVAEALSRRLPPRGRADFDEYMKHFRLPQGLQISNFALLGKTEATLPSDGFSLVDPLDGNVVRCDLLTEVAGFRYYAAAAGDLVRLGAKVEVSPEPLNKMDPRAIVFRINGVTIGYVNRLQTEAFHRWIETQSVDVEIERINGKAGRPRLFLFIRVREKSAHPVAERIAS
ncbi:HIRAN domain-containing protein [Tardiphaga sp. vice278]|uniref:HIRAN domain-containing protein n=1 Tax=Tardiphaga sp. vice278 TaxID=2592815 RepID=UPI001163F0BD|nr:HIRAN domain-containing protein [Tardiphaga sp. vice278]QDM19230.1 hypothetical protein FNL53_27340 [Tardiphaga sp. vice278]